MSEVIEVVPAAITVGAPPEELTKRVTAAVALANSYSAVTCAEAREALGLDLQGNKSLQATVEGERVKITKPINEGLRAVNALFKRMMAPLEDAEIKMKRAALAWDNEQRRIQQEAAADAARKADEEKRRLALLAQAEEAVGNVEAAHVIRDAVAMVAPIPVSMPTPARVSGESTANLWHAEVDDLRELCRAIGVNVPMLMQAIADGKISPDVLKGEVSTENVLPNMPTLNSQARSLKATMRIPGVRAVSEQSLRTRAA